MNRTDIMNRAYEIKRQAAKKYNCQESEIIFDLCLKLAWEEKKTKINIDDRLISVGGKLWERGSMKRIYFNSLYDFAEFSYNTYGTGNISSATISGDSISNNMARKIATKLDVSKVFYDCNENCFFSNVGDSDIESTIFSNIRKCAGIN